MEKKTSLIKRPIILLIGSDKTLSYLLGRYAERCGYQLTVNPENLSVKEITVVSPVVIVFPSKEILETRQVLVGELASLDFPIMVCSSIADEARARELGADYCLTHPITYDDFQTALMNASGSKHA